MPFSFISATVRHLRLSGPVDTAWLPVRCLSPAESEAKVWQQERQWEIRLPVQVTVHRQLMSRAR